MVTIKNVALVGGSGAIGAPILSALLSSGKFNVTVVSREDSKAAFPSSVKVVRADFNSADSLTAAFQGQDAVVSAVGSHALAGQTVIVDAAVAAGVKRILPSEFGSDLNNPLTSKLPVFGHKVAIRKYIEDKIKAGSDITYTYVHNGGFLDWGLGHGFLLNWKEGKPSIYDSGDQLFSMTTLESVAKSVVGILTHYEETKNRSVYIQDIALSQNRLLELAKKAAPEKKWEPVHVKVADIKKDSDEKLARGEVSEAVMVGYILVGIFGEGYGSHFQKLDNDLLGLTGKSEADVEAIWKKILL
ncbi:hypothetical protein F5884DRAFT_313328 [Xylogone sp. PMI_703]|nr:hypothetical protein F5884DRAFT_313328 [Xylogone sp. PMI_703]